MKQNTTLSNQLQLGQCHYYFPTWWKDAGKAREQTLKPELLTMVRQSLKTHSGMNFLASLIASTNLQTGVVYKIDYKFLYKIL